MNAFSVPGLADLVMGGPKSVAIVGAAKNVGKTAVLNYLATELGARGVTVGLASGGWDGEAVDSFTGEPKPAIIPPEGTLVATAEGAVRDLGGALEIADVSDMPRLLGRLVLGRMLESVPIELVGPRSAKEMGQIVRRLHQFGAQIVLVDGALDRLFAASPRVTRAVVFATGAAAGADLDQIAAEAAFRSKLWSIIRPGEDVLLLARQIVRHREVSFIHRDKDGSLRVRGAGFRSCLRREEEVMAGVGDAAFMVVPGALSARLLDEADARTGIGPFAIIARDPVSIFARSMPRTPLFVLDTMDLLALTTNPTGRAGTSLDPQEMVCAVARAVREATGRRIPVFDIVSGDRSKGEEAKMATG